MLKKINRMTTREFDLAWKSGRTVYRGEVMEVRRSGKRWETPKLAVVVGKKTARLAVNRNRLRRVVYIKLEDAVLSQTDSYIAIVRSVDEDKVGKELEKAVKVISGKI